MAGGGVTGSVVPLNRLPAEFTTTHDTDGLPGWGALDWMRPAGSIVGLPVGGTVETVRPYKTMTKPGGAYGRSVYVRTDGGQRLFLTHFRDVFVRPGQRLVAGQPVGTVHEYGKASHIHVAAEGAADKGGRVNLKVEGGGRGIGDRIRDGISAANPLAPVGPDNDKDDGPAGVLNDEWGALKESLPRIAQFGGGAVLLVIGLILLASRMGVARPSFGK